MELEEIRKSLLNATKVDGGLINKVYKVNINNEDYIIKIILDNVDKFELSERISNICFENNINAVNAIKINDRYVNKIDNEYVIVYKYIDGTTIDVQSINNNHIIKIANMLGNIHKIDYKVNYKRIERHSIDWSKFITTNDFNNMKYKDLYLNNYQKFYTIFNKVIAYKNNLKPRLGICHRDIKPSNVIFKNDIPYLIDFESSRVDDTNIDYIETMLRWCGILNFNIDYSKIDLFNKEYAKYIDITNINYKELLYANLLGRFDFLYYNLDITLINKKDNINAQEQVIQMINEINYYINEIDNLINYLSIKTQ